MQIKQFSIGCSRTINLGNFESLRVEATLVVEVPENETEDGYRKMTENAQTELRKLLEDTYKSQHRDRRKEP